MKLLVRLFNHRVVIKRILKDHFDGFWRLHQEKFPAVYRHEIEETVQKAIQCGSRDVGDVFLERNVNELFTTFFQNQNKKRSSIPILHQ